jgi:hypothetical protein
MSESSALACKEPEDDQQAEHRSVEIDTAREWFDLEDSDSPKSITDIAKTCLKDYKKIYSAHTVKAVMHLTAVLEYVKLCEQYHHHLLCKKLVMKASQAIAKCMWRSLVYFP